MNDFTRLALQVAHEAHKGQFRHDGVEAYVNHPVRVAAAVRQHGPTSVAAALLHDVVEDTAMTLADLTELGFPWDVVEAVDALSKRDGETYFEYVRRAVKNPTARVVKEKDILDNRPGASGSMLKRYERALTMVRAAGENES